MQNILSFSLVLAVIILSPLQSSAKLVIADGGGAGYLMENNLPATSLAVAMEADIIKLNLVLTGDNEVIVFSSPYLENGTNVAEIFPDKAREDTHFYVLDFSIEQIRQLTLHDPEKRFSPELHPRFTIATLREHLSLIQGLENSLNRSVPIAVQLVKPWLHRKEERDLTGNALAILQQYGYTGQNDNIFLLTYDVDEIQRLAKELLPAKQMTIKLVQLIDTPEGQENMVEEWGEMHSYNYDWIFSNAGLHSLAGSVAAIVIPKYMLVDTQKHLKLTKFVRNAQKLNTLIFTFPVQKDKQSRVPFLRSFEEELEFFYYTVGVDGVFTDFCADTTHYLKNRTEAPATQIQVQIPTEPSLIIPDLTVDDPLQLTSPLESELEN